MNKRKSAIVGCGGIAQVHAKALRDGDYAELAACADVAPNSMAAQNRVARRRLMGPPEVKRVSVNGGQIPKIPLGI